jgi:hypothetical protein
LDRILGGTGRGFGLSDDRSQQLAQRGVQVRLPGYPILFLKSLPSLADHGEQLIRHALHGFCLSAHFFGGRCRFFSIRLLFS